MMTAAVGMAKNLRMLKLKASSTKKYSTTSRARLTRKMSPLQTGEHVESLHHVTLARQEDRLVSNQEQASTRPGLLTQRYVRLLMS